MLTTNTDRSPKHMSTRRRHFIYVRCAVILRFTDSVGATSLVTCLTLSVNHVYKLSRTTSRANSFNYASCRLRVADLAASQLATLYCPQNLGRQDLASPSTVTKTVWDSPSYLIRDDRFMITKKVQVKQIKIAWQKRQLMLV